MPSSNSARTCTRSTAGGCDRTAKQQAPPDA